MIFEFHGYLKTGLRNSPESDLQENTGSGSQENKPGQQSEKNRLQLELTSIKFTLKLFFRYIKVNKIHHNRDKSRRGCESGLKEPGSDHHETIGSGSIPEE